MQSENSLRTYSTGDIALWKWTPGSPAMIGTSGEKSWKETLVDAIPSPPVTPVAESISLSFHLVGEASNEQSVSLARLCEPVLDVLIQQKQWFSGERANIPEFSVSKTYVTSTAALSGCQIQVYGPPSGTMTAQSHRPQPLFSAMYEGALLPQAGAGNAFSDWMKRSARTPLDTPRYTVAMQFGGSAVNIGNVRSGHIQFVLEHLYPILGGLDDPSQDWRITSLHLEKNCSSVPGDAVKITIDHGPYPRFELRRGDVLLGVLEEYDGNFPWVYCEFTPTPAFEDYAPLFASSLQSLTSKEPNSFSESYKNIRKLRLRLMHSGNEAREFLLHIDVEAKRARFRSARFRPITDESRESL